ncbi:MAG: amidohydrolase family protein [Balneolaceae bacterium]
MKPKTRDLYDSIQKIDAHVHMNLDRDALQDVGANEGFSYMSINTDIPEFDPPKKQMETILKRQTSGAVPVGFMTTFTMKGFGSEGWVEQSLNAIQTGLNNGACGVKIWKNIGMEIQDDQDRFVMVDDPRLDPIFEFMESNGVVLIAHLGEPKNCWLPLEEMTVSSDRDYFSRHPRYHMYKNPEFPSYEEQLAARERRLAKHPDLKFIGLHLASLEWSVEKVARWLDAHPNAGVDLAERVCHLQYQAVDERAKVIDFVTRYQDRIIYGSDQIDDNENVSTDEMQSTIRDKWHREFQFFAEDSEQTAWNVDQPFRGLGLPESIIHKLFRENAIRYYPRLV